MRSPLGFFVVAILVAQHKIFCFNLWTESINQYNELTANAVKIINEIYAVQSPTVNLISSTEVSSELVDKIIEGIFKAETISAVLESSTSITGKNSRNWNFFLVDSVSSFEQIFNKMTSKLFGFHGYYTIVLMNGTANEVMKVFKAMWGTQIHNVAILHANNSSVNISTFNPFSPRSCNDVKPVQVKNLMDLFNDKLKDLKQCSLNVHAPEWAPFTFRSPKNETTGRDFDLMKALSEVLNFKMNFTILTELAAWGMIYDNGTSTGAIQNLIESEADIIIGDYYLRSARIKWMDASDAYFTADIVFVIPPGRTLESIEKLLQPFSRTVWIWISVSLLSALLVVLIFSLWFESRKLVVLYFKMLSVLLSVSLSRLPQKSLNRVLLASFVLSCIVLQAIYQGLLFKFLQTDSKLKEVQSIDEMVQREFKFYSYDSMFEVIQSESRITDR